MRTALLGLAALFLAGIPLLSGQEISHFGSRALPQLKIGPRVIPVSTPSGPAVFSCQVPGASPVCYDPSQIRQAYNIQPLLDAGFNGTGKTIVLIDAYQSPTISSDLARFNQYFGLPDVPNFSVIAPDGLTAFDPNNADMVSWSAEITLDVEWAHAIAPGANIVLVLAKSDADADILSAQKYAVEHQLGDVISQSFGEAESCMDPGVAQQTHQVFVEATEKNITLFASSGDEGAALPTCDLAAYAQAVATPAVDPLVVGVGGTALTAAPYCDTCGTPGTYENEVVWNDQVGASGGGYSVLFNEPVYQRGVVKGGKRGVPDVAYNAASSTGMLAIWTRGGQSGAYIFSGTSAGSPQWAALLAISDQRAGYDLGFINNGLYRLARNPSTYSDVFHDITVGNNSYDGAPGYNAGPGWDPTTGLGSPNGIDFVDHLITAVSPLDGFIAIVQSGPLSYVSQQGSHRQQPH